MRQPGLDAGTLRNAPRRSPFRRPCGYSWLSISECGLGDPGFPRPSHCWVAAIPGGAHHRDRVHASPRGGRSAQAALGHFRGVAQDLIGSSMLVAAVVNGNLVLLSVPWLPGVERRAAALTGRPVAAMAAYSSSTPSYARRSACAVRASASVTRSSRAAISICVFLGVDQQVEAMFGKSVWRLQDRCR